MKLYQIVLALICFGIGFLIADSNLPPLISVLIVVAAVVIGLIVRKIGNKEN